MSRLRMACILFLILVRFDSLIAAEGGTIKGQLLDTDGKITNAGEVVVFLCDQKTGYPIDRQTRQRFETRSRELKLEEQLWFAITSEQGGFEFQDVPEGQYRLVAQSWSGTRGLATFQGRTSSLVFLHGTVNDVKVEPGKQTVAFPRQLGNHVLHLSNDPLEGNAFLLVSLKPTLGDGILGPYGWGEAFMSQLIGVTHMNQPTVTLLGLPPDAAVHVGLFNYDNNPGVGAASFKAGQSKGTVRIIATWSNGHRDPPPELTALTNHLADSKLELESLLPKVTDTEKGLNTEERAIRILRNHPDLEVEVSGLGKRRFADVLAAFGYIRLRK